jgi:predicted P-loop ATPase
VEEFPRQCVFFATTNERTPLRDTTGGRRFWLVDVHEIPPVKDAGADGDLTKEMIDQVWAEAVHYYHKGEKLYLSPELEEVATRMQEDHAETDERIGMVQKYLDTLLPENWAGLGIYERRAWLAGAEGDELQIAGKDIRTKVCALEIFCEVFQGKQAEVTKQNTKEIHDIMRLLPDWLPAKSKLRFGAYGMVKGYERTIKSATELRKKVEKIGSELD